MKPFFTQNRIFLWMLVFLLILNVTAIVSLIYYRNKDRNLVTELPRTMQRMQQMQPEGGFMQQYLGLNEEQFESFVRVRQTFHRRVKGLNTELREKRSAMFTELNKNNPDREKLQDISDEIGKMHKEINIETGNYYLRIREICTPEQREKLHGFFMNTFRDAGQMKSHWQGHGRRPRNIRNFEVE